MLNMEINRVLVVGSWAKEQITIENIRKKSDVKIFAYMSIKNPAILKLVDGYKIGELDNKKKIIDFAKKQKINLALITTARPLSIGVVDALEKEGILIFGPNRKAAKLESDKAYTRKLMKKHGINAIPNFKVFRDSKNTIKYAEKLDWKIAIKPIGLTEGLGVKIYGDQLKNKEDVIDYINVIFNKKIGGHAKVLIEEKLEGDEFTIQCFVYGNHIITTPAVKDYKRLLSGDKGPNTASMGSYSDNGFLLPFMKEKDYLRAVNIMMKTLNAFSKDTNEDCKGFLYGQFMKTDDGVKHIEYNFRPGDPEWLNTLQVMDDSLIDVIKYLMDEIQKPINFENKATVCKYIVPKGYPKIMNQVLEVKFEPKKINNLGVKFYYSSGLDGQGKLRVGCERGIAFISKADTILKANDLVEKAISMVDGDFHYRADIGRLD
jgi:phosphoribosylamine--glycine ligase